MQEYLSSTYFIDSDHPDIITFAKRQIQGADCPKQKALRLYYAVRDQIRYNPYTAGKTPEAMQASYALSKKEGYCVTKAVLLAACARAENIPARLGFADVKNHLNTRKLRQVMGTDIFVYHGYTELFIDDHWVKATPAFNIELCQNFNVKPLEFDGVNDAVFHAYDQAGNRHMEYIKDRGTFADLPFQRILEESAKWYPRFFEDQGIAVSDFHREALTENQAKDKPLATG